MTPPARHPPALLRFAYESAARAASAAAYVAPRGDAKLLRALRARRGIRARFAAWGASARTAERPLLWMHAPSVGEGLQARPVLQRLRAACPDVQIAYTFFSPSAEAFARGIGADFIDYLPFDSTADARAALDALCPTALVFSKLDVWPSLAREASHRGVRLGLVSATLAAGSGRRHPLASALLRDAYARLDAVGAIDADDAERLVELGVRRDAICVTGDTRYDQVWSRAHSVDRNGQLLVPLRSHRATLVAGSTWPADDAVLLPAWRELHGAVPSVRLIIAPHEPTAAHLEPIERWARASTLRVARLGVPDATTADVVLVDRVGVLGELYALADVAFVGGGFHAAGLHSVLEPAAFGAPVLFGPRHQASRDAGLLIACGGGASVDTTHALGERLHDWLTRDDARRRAGDAARALVQHGLGAADRSLALVERLLRGDTDRAG
ncbi:MAG TPA: glycosyltransferase N-terminal domain-containing protein [Gemmatimonadaceae bacterium]|nr:glycosyltransferase N-terminal domain-containing protein [Gemmatimonadaceae bacterium]